MISSTLKHTLPSKVVFTIPDTNIIRARVHKAEFETVFQGLSQEYQPYISVLQEALRLSESQKIGKDQDT